jgi:cell division topological specificity factor
MNIINFFNRRDSAPVARERLQILLSHERPIVGGKPDLVATLREEILAAIAKHISVESENVQIKMERNASSSTIAVDIEIPALAVAV